MNVLALLIIIFKMIIWYMYNPPEFQPENFLSKFLIRLSINLITIWSFTMFWFLYIVSGYWFVFYKWQNYSYIFMPIRLEDLRLYFLYRIIFWLMISGIILQAVALVYDQSELDFFFLDWERTKFDTLQHDQEIKSKLLEENEKEREFAIKRKGTETDKNKSSVV